MTHDTKHKVKVAVTTALLVGATALAGNVTLPNVFTPNTPARASEVNANFSAVKSAVDDNHARLQSVEATVPTLQTNVTTLQGSVGTLQTNVTTLQGSVGTLQTNVSTLQSNVSTLQSNVSTLQTNVSTLQTNVSTLQGTVGTLNSSVTTLNATAWKRTGNLGTNPTTDYLGTADNTPLDLRVNATSVMRLAPGQVSIGTTSPPAGVELSLRGAGYANIYLAQANDSAGFLASVGDALSDPNDPRYHRASFYLDAYDPGFVQSRRLVIDEAGRVALNRADAFSAGQGRPLIVGTDGTNGNGAFLSPGGTWTSTSSRALKHAFAQVNAGAILEQVAGLEISSWEYKGSPEGRHLGPVAEDFHAVFGLAGDGKFIAANDLAGVSLAAVQGLNAKLERENAELRQALAALERRLEKLER